jgi:CBS domain-containing protein
MGLVNRFTPLAQLQAVVLDTETTGLDVASARLLQISAVRFAAGRPATEQTFDTLINPGVPIPPRSTAVHGITDAMVAGAPAFAAVKPTFDRFVDDTVLVGQSIGFDLAVLMHETRRIGEEWRPPRFLDTKLLAAALDPESREFGLDALAARFDVQVTDRHRALGDALVTAQVLARLLPALAAAGIRTLADAEAHSNAQTRIRARQSAEGWYDATSIRPADAYESGREAASFERLDTFLYRHRAHHVMTPAVIVPPATPLLEAVRLMVERELPAVLAGDAAAARADGILSQRDVLRALARNAGGLDEKLEAVMSGPVATLPRDALLYRALARMQRLAVQHLAVADASQRVVGLLSLRDLVVNHGADALVLGDELSGAHSPHDLAVAHAKLPAVTRQLLADGVDPREIAVVVTVEMHELLGRAAAQAERRMESQGDGRPPVPYALLALGRSGRGECLLVPETDHAIVFESGEPDGVEDRWFAAFAAHMDAVLGEAGMMPRGGASATCPPWRRSLEAWRAEVARWAAAPETAGAALVHFFDFAFVYGDADLAADLRELSLDLGARSRALVRALMPGAPAPRAAGQRVDLEAAGLAAIEAAGRSLAVATRAGARATAERLAEAVTRTGMAQATADALIETHQMLVRAVIEQQHADVADGLAPSFAVDLSRLADAARARLSTALEHTSGVRALVRTALATV